MVLFVAFVIAGIGTYLIRLSGILLLGGNREFPQSVTKTLHLIGPAALAAIIASGVALCKRSMGWTLVVGAISFAVLLALGR